MLVNGLSETFAFISPAIITSPQFLAQLPVGEM